MKGRKLAAIVLSLAASAAFALGLSACGKSQDGANLDDDPFCAVYQTYVANAESNSQTALSYELWLASIKGEKGDRGETGPQGPQGEKGDKGDKGDPGSDGKDGADGQNGQDGAPGKDGENGKDGQDGTDGLTPYIGTNGNWWIGETDTGVKARGSDGQNGKDGQDGAPGKDGENGKDGQDGAPGKDGQDGAPGKDGQDGAPGKDGQNGKDGKDGQDGAPGKSAYEIWLANGNTGSEEDFLNWLKGAPGKDGAYGQNGKDGAPGKSAYEIWLANGNAGSQEDFLNWLKGADGQNGDKGDKGDPGKDGQDGAPGKDGENGKDGQDGAPGKDGENGKDGQDGAPGKDGQDGVGIEKVEIDNDGNLVITYTDGNTQTVAVSHDWQFAYTLVAAKCEASGLDLYTCDHCGLTKLVTTPGLEHDYLKVNTYNPTCTSQGYDYYRCSVCRLTYNRADFQRMMKDSDKKLWDYVLVYKLDRFSRNKYEMAIHRKHLKDNGIKILSAMENIPDSPEGILLESLLEGYKRSNGHNKNNLRIKAA